MKDLSKRHLTHEVYALVFILLISIIGFLNADDINLITGAVSSSICGNNICEVEENPENCAEDCKSICGNELCEAGEEFTCSRDCVENNEALVKGSKFKGSAFVYLITAVLAVIIILLPTEKSKLGLKS